MAVKIKVVNRRALRKYGEFWRALQMVGNAMDEAGKLANKAVDAGRDAKGTAPHWATPTPDEMKAATKRPERSLRTVVTAAKKWEAELISRDWRR